ncbi:MAG: glycine cleavage T C-terminal barrel domain-containing protein, partial [Candidatus Methylomirabilia bacterium]
LDKFLISERATFTDLTEALALLALYGPAAASVVAEVTGSAQALEPFQHLECTVARVPVRLCRVDELGVPGFHLWVPAQHGAHLWRHLLDVGRPYGLTPVGGTALTVQRIEAGIPSFGHDVDERTLLMEAPLDYLVHYSKGCYIGQEVVARIKYRGHVNRFLTGLTLEGARVPQSGAVVLAGEREVGRVTSAVHSLALNRPIALALLRREEQSPGTTVMVKDHDQIIPARVTALPFVRST